ncbi:MAG: serine/threonine-protein phosphatase, partial [Chlamydiales bacterium]|nr:serine/threonine-protein phosphatase [Chlamydiales bacterium]
MQYQIESFGMTDVGKVRANNEDAFDILPNQSFFSLADGMGGHKAGEIASNEAILSMHAAFEKAPPFSSNSEACRYLLDAIEQTNRKIWSLSVNDKTLSGMGTTLSCFLIYKDLLIYAHIGDSRLYRYRKSLKQISHDHSLRAILQEESDIDPQLLNLPGFKNVITKALGTQPHILPDIGIIPILSEDIYMLCSDGLTDLISNPE